MRKNKQSDQKATPADEPPFDRGFWSGKKGFAIGSASTGNDVTQNQEPIFGRVPNQYGGGNDVERSAAYPADLRREGPFAKDKVVVPKATIAQAAPTAGVFQPNTDVRTVGASSGINGQQTQKRILQLDDFEPQTKAWRRTQKEPVAPRVHPNPTPVIPAKGKTKAKPIKTNGGSFTAPNSAEPTAAIYAPHTSTEKPSIVMPLAMIFTLFVLIGGGYIYLSNLSEQNSQQANNASRERQVKLAETMLLNLDYKPGIIDGKIDNSLTNAVRAFQRDSLLQEDGLITPELITELEAILAIYEAS